MKKPYIIAEIGVNYYDIATKENISNMEAAKLMILEAHKAGADAAKFQSYKTEKLASKNSPAYWDTKEEKTKSQYQLFKKFDSFGSKEYEELHIYCKKIGIEFMSTPFDLEAVEYLNNIVNKFKIASADLTNYPMLKKISEKKKPMIISVGASTISEIDDAVRFIRKINDEAKIILLHCVLSYPTDYENANLYKIKKLKELFAEDKNISIGYSDHTKPDPGMSVVTTAWILGAEVIEKHFTLDKTLKGNDHYHAMDPNDLKVLKNNIEVLTSSLLKKDINYLICEKSARKEARRSIVLKNFKKKGEIIKDGDLIMKRPGTGISPKNIDWVIGRKASKNLQEDKILDIGDLD